MNAKGFYLPVAGCSFLFAFSFPNDTSAALFKQANPNAKQAQEERHFTIPHTPHSGLEIRTTFGSISAVADPSLTSVEVLAKIQAGGPTMDAARTNLAKIVVKTERRPDNTLEIRAEFPKEKNFSGGCSFEIRIPDADGVKATTANGSVRLKALAGKADAQTSFGSITISKQRGPVQAHTSNGAINLDKIGGPVYAETSFGQVVIRGVEGKVQVIDRNGSIEASDVTDSVQATTSFGAVTIHNAGGDVYVKDSNGAVTVEKAKGDVRAVTTFGTVDVRESTGEADLESSNGAITYRPASENKSPFKLRTTFGSVGVKLPASVSGKIQAKTSFGHISVAGPRKPISVTGDKNRKEITLADAGPESHISTSNGSIEIDLR